MSQRIVGSGGARCGVKSGSWRAVVGCDGGVVVLVVVGVVVLEVPVIQVCGLAVVLVGACGRSSRRDLRLGVVGCAAARWNGRGVSCNRAAGRVGLVVMLVASGAPAGSRTGDSEDFCGRIKWLRRRHQLQHTPSNCLTVEVKS